MTAIGFGGTITLYTGPIPIHESAELTGCTPIATIFIPEGFRRSDVDTLERTFERGRAILEVFAERAQDPFVPTGDDDHEDAPLAVVKWGRWP